MADYLDHPMTGVRARPFSQANMAAGSNEAARSMFGISSASVDLIVLLGANGRFVRNGHHNRVRRWQISPKSAHLGGLPLPAEASVAGFLALRGEGLASAWLAEARAWARAGLGSAGPARAPGRDRR